MITDDQAATIAYAWHSVMTWNDPGVVMYSVTSTGKVHSEKHRAALLEYIAGCMSTAAEIDANNESDDEPVRAEVMESNVADLEALREWVVAYRVGAL